MVASDCSETGPGTSADPSEFQKYRFEVLREVEQAFTDPVETRMAEGIIRAGYDCGVSPGDVAWTLQYAMRGES